MTNRNLLISNYAELSLRELREAGRRKPETPIQDEHLNYRSLEYYLEYSVITREDKVCNGLKRPWNCDHDGLPFVTNIQRWIREMNEQHNRENTGAVVLAAALRDSKTDAHVASAKNVYAAQRI